MKSFLNSTFASLLLIAMLGSSGAARAADAVSAIAGQLCVGESLKGGIDRESLTTQLAETGAAAQLRVHPDGSTIPVVLMNQEALKNPAVADLTKHSLGFMMDISSGSSGDIDHGSFRVGDKIFVDYGGQGHRKHQGELHDTGLLHRDFSEYMRGRAEGFKKKGSSRAYIELVFPASPEQIDTALFYHRMRQAGIVRTLMESTVRYEGEGTKNYFRNLPHTLSDCGVENCVTYGTGTRLWTQIAEMRNRIESLLGHWDVNKFLEDPNVQQYVAAARQELIRADWKNPEKLNQRMFDRPEFWSIIEPALPSWLKSPEFHNRAYELMCMVVGQDAALHYVDISHTSGAHVYIGRDTDPWDHRPRAYSDKKPELDSRNPAAVAVYVYAEGPDAERRIREGHYEYVGAKHGIFRSENSPSGFRQAPLPKVEEPSLQLGTP